MKAFNHSRAARGFSLLELMVAIAISLLLLMGVIALFISSRSSYETTERMSRIQENGRYALDMITSSLREAGFQGCSKAVGFGSAAENYNLNRLNDDSDTRWNFAIAAQGFQTTGTSFSPDISDLELSPEASTEGDVLVVRVPRREETTHYLRTEQEQDTDPLVLTDATANFDVGETLMISDCYARAWFEVTGYAGGVIDHAEIASHTDGATSTVFPGNKAGGGLLHPFKAGSTIVPVETQVYYLGLSSADGTKLSLWRKTAGAQQSDEIAAGIDRLEILYGLIDDTGRVTSYVSAADVTDWDNVYSVQLSLLARASDTYGNDLDNQEYVLLTSPTQVITAGPYNDRYVRKVFTATVALRNQIYN